MVKALMHKAAIESWTSDFLKGEMLFEESNSVA